MNLLSVIIPVYNVKPYLRRCVDSVLSQDYKPIEIILVDDGSTDGSSDICDEYKMIDSVHVVHQENKGLSMARNAGLDIAKGDYIAFLDSDDYVEPNMYSTLISLSLKYNKDIAACATQSFTEDDTNKINTAYDDLIKTIEWHNMLGDLYCNQNARSEVWNKIYRRKVVNSVRFKAKQKFEDLYFDRIVFQNSNGCVFLNTPLHHYLVTRPGNTNSSFDSNKLCAFEELEDIKNDLLKAGHREDSDRILAMQLFFSMFLGCQCYMYGGKQEDREYINRRFLEYKNSNRNNSFTKNIKWRVVLYSISPSLLVKALKILKKIG